MTKEEEQIFLDKVKETILPLAMSMSEDQIKNIILTAEKDNPNLPEGFGAMLFEKVIVYKQNLILQGLNK